MTQMNTPVLVGVAQLLERESDPAVAMMPLQMLTQIAWEASEHTGVGESLLKEIDTIGIVEIPPWDPRNGPALLGEQLGVKPACTLSTVASGEIPLVLVNHVAKRIGDGQTRVALIAGANNIKTLQHTKYFNAILDTNQAAGVVMLSAQAAGELGIAKEKQVYWWGGTSTQEDPWFVSERPNLADSPSLHRCAEETFARTGTSIEDMEFIDFYSCFPVAVELAAEAFSVEENDPRGLTVTGGLPYAGGPGSNYALHSLATMVGRLRNRPGATGLVTGNGMFLSNHSSVVISSEPRSPSRGDAGAKSSISSKNASPTVAEEASGQCSVEAYTVIHDRNGAPELGIVIGRLHDERRFVANTPSDRAFLEDFVAVEQVGRTGQVKHIDGRNVFEPS